MSDQPATPRPNGAPQPGGAQSGGMQLGPGPLTLNLQFIKDLSFEVPGAPGVFTALREPPRVDLQLDVQARQIGDPGVFEVALQIRADARAPMGPAGQGQDEPQTCFIAELLYCGIFTLDLAPEHLEPVLLVECPRLLFPFARNILADVTRDGGFPPVLLAPIDFVALWQARRNQSATVATA